MELRHLKYFVVLAEELHFGHAASRLSITQPPLSFNVRQLEDDLGFKLFERDTRRVLLTPAGRAFLVEARHILSQVERARDVAGAVSDGRIGRLDVGFSGSMIYVGLPQLIADFSNAHPGVEVSLLERGFPEQVDRLIHGHLDAAFVHATHLPAGLAGILLSEEPFVCCLSSSHPLARGRKIDLRRVAEEPFVIAERDGAPALYDRIVSICVEAGFQPLIRHAARHWLTIIALVAQGFGVALVPARMAQSGLAGVSFLPLRSSKVNSSNGYLLWNESTGNPALPLFVGSVRATVQQAGAVRSGGAPALRTQSRAPGSRTPAAKPRAGKTRR